MLQKLPAFSFWYPKVNDGPGRPKANLQTGPWWKPVAQIYRAASRMGLHYAGVRAPQTWQKHTASSPTKKKPQKKRQKHTALMTIAQNTKLVLALSLGTTTETEVRTILRNSDFSFSRLSIFFIKRKIWCDQAALDQHKSMKD